MDGAEERGREGGSLSRQLIEGLLVAFSNLTAVHICSDITDDTCAFQKRCDTAHMMATVDELKRKNLVRERGKAW